MKGYRTVFLAGVTFVLNVLAFVVPGEELPDVGQFGYLFDQFVVAYDTVILPLASVWLRSKTDTPIFTSSQP